MAVGEFKARFSEALKEVADGAPIAISYGRRHDKVAVLVAYDDYVAQAAPRRLGVLQERGTYRIGNTFSISDEELLTS